MRFGISSRGNTWVSFGALGCLVYAAAVVVVTVAVALAYVLRGLALGVAWLVRELVAAWRRQREAG